MNQGGIVSFPRGGVFVSAAAALFCCFHAAAQTPPVITGANGATSAAFWYLGGISPNCCPSLTNKYWTIWAVTLTLNTPHPNPTVQWFTDSPTKLQIVPTGTTGAILEALGHSNPGPSFDINVWVKVNGVSSAMFPVYLNTPWVQSQTGPSSATCVSFFGLDYPNGWVGQVTNTVRDLAGNTTLVQISLLSDVSRGGGTFVRLGLGSGL